MVVRRSNGKLQLRLAPPGRMTEEAWDILLERLEETNNLRLAAAAAGIAHSSVIARARGWRSGALEIAAARGWAKDYIERLMRAPIALPPVDEDAPLWPPGLTVAQALHTLGAPPLKLPGTPFPARKKPILSEVEGPVLSKVEGPPR